MKQQTKERLKGMISGVVLGTLLVGGGVFAKQATETIEVEYSNIKVYKDNVLCELKDANGSVIEPFIYNGTTYMPVRGTASLADMQVTWDGATQSVYLWDEMVPEGTPFLEVCPPYDKNECSIYLAVDGDSFSMAGEKYSNGIAEGFLQANGYALFNLNGKYSTIECTVGHTGNEQRAGKSVSFIVDGKVIKEIELEPECLPKKISIPVSYGLQLKIQFSGSYIGLGNMTIH